MKNEILIAIPAYNEAEYLDRLLFEIETRYPKMATLVVDDGSFDGTDRVIRKHRVLCLSHEENRGKGASLRSAITFAKSKGYEWLITMDADGQHLPKDLPAFIEKIRKDDSDIIVGNRMGRKSRMPIARQISNGLTSILISLFLKGQRLHDTQCGFRAIRLSAIDPRRLFEDGFQFESELLLLMGRQQRRMAEVAIHTVYGSEKSSIRPFSDTAKFILLLAKMILKI